MILDLAESSSGIAINGGGYGGKATNNFVTGIGSETFGIKTDDNGALLSSVSQLIMMTAVCITGNLCSARLELFSCLPVH